MNSQMRSAQAHTGGMKYVSARDMVSSQNNNQCCGQCRAVKTKSNPSASHRHKVSLVALQPPPAASQGESKLCYRGTKFTQARQSCQWHGNCACESSAALCYCSCHSLCVSAYRAPWQMFCQRFAEECQRFYSVCHYLLLEPTRVFHTSMRVFIRLVNIATLWWNA